MKSKASKTKATKSRLPATGPVEKEYHPDLNLESLLISRGEESRLCEDCASACRQCAGGETKFQWLKTKKAFLESQEVGSCSLCNILWKALGTKALSQLDAFTPDQQVKLQFKFVGVLKDPTPDLDVNERWILSIEASHTHKSDSWLEISSDSGNGLDIYLALRLRAFDAESDLIPTNKVDHGTTNCTQNITLVTKWLENCVNNHRRCRAIASRGQSANWKPSRLLDIGTHQTPKLSLSLVGDREEKVRYCALSYCRGKVPFLTLTQEKLASFQEAIPEADLPTTIRDAIQFTRSLGIQYLWVDALCIIQDSKPDWVFESSQMNSIYHSAFCTVFAAAPEQAVDSMFRERNPLPLRPCKVSIDGKGGSTDYVVYPLKPEKLFMAGLHGNHLADRGWALQERLLSPRSIYFGAEQVLWSCAELNACETFPTGSDLGLNAESWGKQSFSALKKWVLSPRPSDGMVLGSWAGIVNLYSSAHLSFESDKLTAIQGIATKVIENLGSTTAEREQWTKNYVAGLWVDKKLIAALLWRTIPGDRRRKRPTTYRAPSWTWTSVDGEILISDTNSGNEVAKVQSISTTPADPTIPLPSTGQIIGGHIDLQGALFAADLLKSLEPDTSDLTPSDAVVNIHLDEKGTDKGRVWENVSCILDEPDSFTSGETNQVFCMPLMLSSHTNSAAEVTEIRSGLVLQLCTSKEPISKELENYNSNHKPEGELPIYRRIGIFYGSKDLPDLKEMTDNIRLI